MTTPPDEEAGIEAATVRALEWSDYFEDEDDGDDILFRGWEDPTEFETVYRISSDEPGFTVSHDFGEIGEFATDEEAKSAAQADYERRVHAALVAHKAALCPPDPDIHDPQEDIKEFLQGYEGPPDTSLYEHDMVG